MTTSRIYKLIYTYGIFYIFIYNADGSRDVRQHIAQVAKKEMARCLVSVTSSHPSIELSSADSANTIGVCACVCKRMW